MKEDILNFLPVLSLCVGNIRQVLSHGKFDIYRVDLAWLQ
jgi:hypothetical protein